MPRLDLTDSQLRRTPGALLIFRILSHITTDTDLQPLINHVHKMKVVPGEPPKSKNLPAPAIYCWPNREMIMVEGEDGLEAGDWYFTVKMVMKNLKSYTAIPLNSDGTWKNAMPVGKSDHTGLLEILWMEERLKYVLNYHGHQNNWYYTFVQNGCLGEPNQIQFDFREFGGGDSKSELLHVMTFSFRVRTWDHRTVLVANGDAVVTVVDSLAAPVQGAKVTITDITGNYVEDEDGKWVWTTDAAGEAAIPGLIATRNDSLTIAASKGALSGTLADQDISQTAADNTFTVTIT